MRRPRWLVAAALAPAVAAAQNVSDVNPDPEAAKGMSYPGSPLTPRTAQGVAPQAPAPSGAPAAGRGSPGARGPGAGGAVPTPAERPANAGRGYAILDDPSAVIAAADESPGPESIPESHVVQKGDTLWDISSTYFRNPWYWPKLWSYNPLITNPHWIYPGDAIRLYPLGESRPLMPAPAPEQQPETPRAAVTAAETSNSISLRQNGFVEQGELDAAASIVGSREEKMMLATLDEAYVEFSSQQPLAVGERYTVYRVVSDVKHPESGQRLGALVEIVGEVEVRGASGRIARAVITEALNPVERGFRVGPLRRLLRVVDPVPAKADLTSIVAGTLLPTRLLGSEMLIFLDKGKRDQVEVGNRFQAVRRGDGYGPILSDRPMDDRRFPREVIAEVLVIEVRERTATAVVIKSVKEVRIGDRLEARQGR